MLYSNVIPGIFRALYSSTSIRTVALFGDVPEGTIDCVETAAAVLVGGPQTGALYG